MSVSTTAREAPRDTSPLDGPRRQLTEALERFERLAGREEPPSNVELGNAFIALSAPLASAMQWGAEAAHPVLEVVAEIDTNPNAVPHSQRTVAAMRGLVDQYRAAGSWVQTVDEVVSDAAVDDDPAPVPLDEDTLKSHVRAVGAARRGTVCTSPRCGTTRTCRSTAGAWSRP